jgi:hypothetical protein
LVRVDDPVKLQAIRLLAVLGKPARSHHAVDAVYIRLQAAARPSHYLMSSPGKAGLLPLHLCTPNEHLAPTPQLHHGSCNGS